jgi:hypothetical protein
MENGGGKRTPALASCRGLGGQDGRGLRAPRGAWGFRAGAA